MPDLTKKLYDIIGKMQNKNSFQENEKLIENIINFVNSLKNLKNIIKERGVEKLPDTRLKKLLTIKNNNSGGLLPKF